MLTPVLPAAEKQPPAAPPRKKLSAVSVLPDGSQLHGVMFPRYDENHRLTGVLKAEKMTLVDDENISGETVCIEFFNEDGSARGRVDLTRAVFNQAKGLLNAKESVTMHSDRFNATGSGVIYAFDQGEGYLLGPVITWIQNPTATTMNSSHSPLRATAILGMSLLALPLAAVPPPPVSPRELEVIQTETASSAALAGDAAMIVRNDLAKDTAEAAVAAKAATVFLAQAGIPVPEETDPPAAEPKPLEVKPGPNDTEIKCDGGMYFDADEGLLVYLKNVRVTDPRFTLTGANELKIFLEKKPANTTPKTTPQAGDPPPKDAKKPATKDPLGGGIGVKFGDVERVYASGAVRFLQKQPEPGKQPIEASGAIFTYHPKTGQIIIKGGYPWVKQGPTYMRAEQPNLILRILNTGSFVTEGKWVMGGPLQKAGNPQPKR